ncbi:MAG: guanylate kinase [Oscillospiraceae bacterium]|nr:guanylate kinase [Oscillospiraceae bacterium]
MSKGLLIVVSAPSGCGKGTVLAEVLKRDNFYYSVSATTRPPRPEDVDGVTYHFLTREKFEELIASGGVLEYAEYCGNYYGTPKKAVEDKLSEGKDVILEIEVQGAMKIKELCPEAVFIFILPPSLETLRERLEKRGTETAEVINKRVAEAKGEIEKSYNYDYVIVNDDLSEAVSDFIKAVDAEKLTAKRNISLIDSILGK